MYQHSSLFWCSKWTREMVPMTLPMKEKKPCGLAQAPQSPTSSKPRRAMQGCAPNVTALHSPHGQLLAITRMFCSAKVDKLLSLWSYDPYDLQDRETLNLVINYLSTYLTFKVVHCQSMYKWVVGFGVCFFNWNMWAHIQSSMQNNNWYLFFHAAGDFSWSPWPWK